MAYLQSLRRLIVLFCIPLMLLFAIGCVSQKPRGPQEDAGSPSVSPAEGTDLGTMFPHPDGWENPASHGVWVVQYGSPDPCLQCHKKISTEAEVMPTCSSCHPLYPHKNDWIKKESHGNAFIVKGRGVCATQCHGYDLQGGLSGIACNLCHTIYPHTTGWVVPGEHGEVAKGTGKDLCKGCHGDDLKGGSSGVSCTQCHTHYPHADDWRDAAQHGQYVLDNGKTDCMTKCHGMDLQGGLSGIACNSCHDLYPHSETWELDHQAAALTLGKDACKGCHGDDLKKLLDGKNCFSCHPDYPHDSSTWLPFTGGHGGKVQVTYAKSTVQCQGCHGVDCSSCHLSYPHQDPPGFTWPEYEGHGQYTLLNGKNQCTVCHGAAYDGTVTGRANPTCFNAACHVSYPHLDGWRRPGGQPQEHGNYVVTNGTASCATARCHGVGLIPTPGVTNGIGCDDCHTSYPHTPGWDHGSVAKADIDICKVCHGAGLDTAPPGHQSCVQCHPSYLRHETAELGYPLWGFYSGHGDYVMSPPQNGNYSECEVCHGVDAAGPIATIKTCQDGSSSCHASFPHTQANWDEDTPSDPGHGDYVHTTLSDNLGNCDDCHGNDLMGGISGRSCFECHPNYPHESGWYDPTPGAHGGSHGPEAYGAAKNNCNSAGCHGVDFSGGTVGDSCIGCHPDFPHTDPNWGAIIGDANLHASRFYQRVHIDGIPTACQGCHGAAYDRVLEGNACTTCHPSGVTHGVGWSLGTGHGTYFTTYFDALSTTFCQDCHGAPIAFTDTPLQTKVTLAAQSDCYSCHWTYPHTGYDISDDMPDQGVYEWEWTPPDPVEWGHVFHLSRNLLVTTSGGIHPFGGNMDPLWTPALQNSCGGSTMDSCHFDGYRTSPTGSTSTMCGTYCHSP